VGCFKKAKLTPLRMASEDANPSCSPTIQREGIILRILISKVVGGGYWLVFNGAGCGGDKGNG